MSAIPRDPGRFFSEFLPAWSLETELALPESSAGSLLFRVLDVGEWVLRVHDRRLVVEQAASDVILQVTVSQPDFELLVVGAIEASPSGSPNVFALRTLDENPERAKLVRALPGSLRVDLTVNGAQAHRVLLTPGPRIGQMDHPECTLELPFDELANVQRGATNPLQLFMEGKIQISGDAQIAMALSGLFA